MSALLIGPAEQDKINSLIEYAEQHVLDVVKIRKTPDETVRDMMTAFSIDLPVGYSVTYSHELQPHAGLCHHISIAIDRPNKMPSPHAVDMILDAFGMKSHKEADELWVEKVNDTLSALNIVQVVSKQ